MTDTVQEFLADRDRENTRRLYNSLARIRSVVMTLEMVLSEAELPDWRRLRVERDFNELKEFEAQVSADMAEELRQLQVMVTPALQRGVA